MQCSVATHKAKPYLGGRHCRKSAHVQLIISSFKVSRAVVGSFKKPIADHVDGELPAANHDIANTAVQVALL